MMLTNKMTQAEQPLEALYPVSGAQSLPDSSGFSGLFSSMVTAQGGGEKKIDSLLQMDASTINDTAANLIQPLPEAAISLNEASTVGKGDTDLELNLLAMNRMNLNRESASLNVEASSDVKTSGDLTPVLPPEPTINNSPPPLLETSVLETSINASVDLSVQALGQAVEESEGLMTAESLNEISPPPMTVLEDPKLDSMSSSQTTVIDNQPLGLASSHANMDAFNQNGHVDLTVVQKESITEEALSSSAQAGNVIFNPLNPGNNQASTSWGTQVLDGQASQGNGQQGQSFGQSAQHGSGQSAQQQALMFAQAQQDNKQQSLDQQMAVRAMDETIAKSEGKELLGAEIASFDRKNTLPLGLQAINLPLKHPQWGQALGQRIVFMSNNSLQQAQITLNPQSLGQIQVTLQLDKDQKMHVSLVAQSGMTRESMENALPRLRDMMEQSGIQLGSVDVREQKQFSEHDTNHAKHEQNTSKSPLVEEGFIEESPLVTVGLTDNIVDYYA